MRKVNTEYIPSLDIKQPYTRLQSFSEQLQFDIQFIPYSGKLHSELQLIP